MDLNDAADYIETVIEEGLRERAIKELKVVDEVSNDVVVLVRDDAEFLIVEIPNPDVSEEEQEEILDGIESKWSTTTGLHYKLSRRLVESVIDKDITELL